MSRFLLLTCAFLCGVLMFATSCLRVRQDAPAIDPTISLYPAAEDQLWGYQDLTITYDFRRNLKIRDITMDTGAGPRSIITPSSSLRSRDGVYELSWCAQCVQAPQVNVTVTFDGDVPPIRRTYRLIPKPVVDITAEYNPESGAITLDASGSRSPAGRSLSFAWHFGERSGAGPVFTADASSLAKIAAILTVSDRIAEMNQLVTVELDDNGRPKLDPTTHKPIKIYSDEQLRCTDLKVVDEGFSLINPSVPLGPDPAATEPQQIPVSDGKVSRSFYLSHKFDIVATIVPDTANLHEGQDAAVTVVRGSRRMPLKGKTRPVGSAAGVFGPEIEAPYPEPAPTPGPQTSPPPTVEDGYEAHPLNGLIYTNTPQGAQGINVKKKDFDSSKSKLVWFDQPGLSFNAGGTMEGGSKHMYIHVWVVPDRAKCEKFFIIEMDYDATGKITKNKLTPLN